MVFGLFNSSKDASEIDAVLAEVERLGRRMGGLATMDARDRALVVTTFKLYLILDQAPEHKKLLLDARRKVLSGDLNLRTIRSELRSLSETYSEFHHFLDVVNRQGGADEPKMFVERVGVESLF